MATSKKPTQSEDLVSSFLDILPDKILEFLPIRFAAKTSVLSKQWRSNWLSLKHLVFNDEFFENRRGDWQERSNVITNILLHHDGLIHEFILSISEEGREKCIDLPQWLCFLSKKQVKLVKIQIHYMIDSMPISSNIFWCSELIHLDLFNLTLHPPPSGFSGFPKLQHLSIECIRFSQENIFPILMAKCRILATLNLVNCCGMGDIVIDVPSLGTLYIYTESMHDSLAFRDVTNLKNISVHLDGWLDEWVGEPTVIQKTDSFNNLSKSRQLQCIEFSGPFCKFCTAASIKRLERVAFKRVNKLSLHDLDLGDPGVLQNIFDMVESCPFMKEFIISVTGPKDHSGEYGHHKLDSSKIYKSPHLVEVKITGITGLVVEIQLIEYLLTVAVELERLIYKCYSHYTDKLSRVLLGIPRASPKARVVCLM